MAHKYRLDFDGQSVVQTDYNGLATEASTSEDHVYAELFRLAPDDGSTVVRGYIPYGKVTISANGASGSVVVNPFRAIVGTRTLVGSDAVANYQDVRSSLSVADGSTALTTIINLAANASGNSRFDAIYAAVTVDAVSTPTTRKVKNPGTGVVTDESVSVYSHTTVSVSVVTGTPGATPALPSIPSDAGNVYYVLIGYVRVPTGWNGSSTMLQANINESGNALAISSATGASNLRPATGNYRDNGAGIIRTGTSGISNSPPQHWTGTNNTRPAVFLPSSMQGCEARLIVIDLTSASSANWSHANGDVLDDSVDWNSRVFKWNAWVGMSSSLPWNYSAGTPSFTHFLSGGSVATPGYAANTSVGAHIVGMGNSMSFQSTGNDVLYLASSGASATATPAPGFNVPTNAMASGTIVEIYSSGATPGTLKLKVTGAPLCMIFLWLEATGRYF